MFDIQCFETKSNTEKRDYSLRLVFICIVVLGVALGLGRLWDDGYFAPVQSEPVQESVTWVKVAFPATFAKIGTGILSFDAKVENNFIIGIFHVSFEVTQLDGIYNYSLFSGDQDVQIRECWAK